MKETITIKNFGGLKDAVIPLNSINIFIGKQASGKSVTAKLIYFFRKFFTDVFDGLNNGKKNREIEEEIKERFKKYFPPNSWAKGDFSIKYESGKVYEFVESGKTLIFSGVEISRKSISDIKINKTNIFKEIKFLQKQLFEPVNKLLMEEKLAPADLHNLQISLYGTLYQSLSDKLKVLSFQMFVPAGRSFFSNIQSSIFSILSAGNSIDPFLVEFGSYYERFKYLQSVQTLDHPTKQIHNDLEKILNAKFISEKSGEYLAHTDGRKINLLFCSSGQQEILPLALILANQKAVLESLKMSSITLYIEEPEAHLFPSAQKTVVEMIATTHNLAKGKSQLVITTHSPYILTAFNNLLQAGYLLEQGADKEKLFKIVPEFEVLKCGELNAYAFQDGGVVSLIDEETGLISADMLDQVSEEIAIQFDELLELETSA